MFVVEQNHYCIKQVAALLGVTPQAVNKERRLHGTIGGVKFKLKVRPRARVLIPEHIYLAIKERHEL